MLQKLSSEVHVLACTDEVDETASTRKWNNKAAEQLEKLNSDCNRTAGLEAKLSVAVGARVMLRRNIDTRAGFVNGALGTVLSIAINHVIVQFDHAREPYNVQKVKSRFMVMKNFYVYRQQFPLILAYAVTIHKSQGLSLNCAIVDLSDKVFSAGMAYIALSRVQSLSGLHLSAFDPNSIMVCQRSLKEVNRLRQTYRADLPLYDPPKRRANTKRKLTGSIEDNQPKAKRSRALPQKRKRASESEDQKPLKQPRTIDDGGGDDDHDYDPRHQQLWPFAFHSVDEQWQHNACAIMGLHFHGTTRVRPGGPNVPLKRPDLRTVKTDRR
jgi:hypothetical protein